MFASKTGAYLSKAPDLTQKQTKPEKLGRNKHSILFGPFISCGGNEVL
jgi:hypothetical protein